MKRKRYSVEQIVAVLKQAEMGNPVADLIWHAGITEQTFYRWKKKYAGLESDQVRELKQVLEENTRLKHGLLRNSVSTNPCFRMFCQKVSRPALMKEVVAYIVASHGYSERKACQVTRQHRSTQRKKMFSDPLIELRQRMHEIAATRIRYGYRRVHIMLKREGWKIGRNRVHRVYREEGLVLKTRRPQGRKMATHREARCQPKAPNEAWSLDFVHDQLSNGQKIRALTIIDVYTRECLAIEVGYRLRGGNVVEVLNRLVPLPRRAQCAVLRQWRFEFTGQMVDLWGSPQQGPHGLLETPPRPQTMRISSHLTARCEMSV